ncbi:WD domain, G-beta repeat protein [Dictyocaulus viviparus]|uniref:WD domain, G-beta repeat protein n=1 Tax=Dictyocaulus viviparus TaxID=29172 RepID=A0A0D8XF53_DICVI|nr:WD domain, G-beta repeat protein [Dictyocaulus viviparus]
MGITKDYQRYKHTGSCGCVGSSNGEICAIDAKTCAVTACENVCFYNMRTSEKVDEISEATDSATCMKVSHDRRWLAVGYADGVVRLFDRKSDETTSVVFCGHKKGVSCLAFSTDGLLLASGGKDCAVIVWDIVSESGLFRLNGHKGPVTNLAFAKMNQFLLSSSKDCLIKFWSISSQSCFYSLFDSHCEVYSFCLLQEDTTLLVANGEAELLVYGLIWLEEGKVLCYHSYDEPDKKKWISEVQTNEDLAGNMANRYIRTNLRGKLSRQCKGRAFQLAVSPDQRFVLCLGSDRVADIYRVFNEAEASKRLTKKLKSAKKRMTSSISGIEVKEEDIRKDVTLLITHAGEYRTNAKLKWADFTLVCKVEEDGSTIYSIFALMSNNTINLLDMRYDLPSNNVLIECVSTLDKFGHRSDIRGLSVSSSNNAIVSGGGDELIIWNTRSFRPVASFRDESMSDVTAVVFATGDNYVVAGTKTGELFLWDVAGCELLECRKGHEGAIWGITHTVDGKQIITVSSDKKAKFWSYELVSEGVRKRLSLRESRILEVPDEALCCALSPDGKFIVIGLLDNTAAVYFVDTLKFFISLYGHSLPVTCVTISPNSKLVVTGSADKSIKIWGLDFGDCHKSLHAHTDVVSAVMFSPSDELLVWSAGRDGKIKQWDAQKMCRVQVLNRHSAEVRALAQTDTGNLLASFFHCTYSFIPYLPKFQFSASHDKSLRCWELTDDLIVVEEDEEMERIFHTGWKKFMFVACVILALFVCYSREEDYEARLMDKEDLVPGEIQDSEATVASIKNKQSITSAENIIEAVDVFRNEMMQIRDDPSHKPHPLMIAFNSKSSYHFIVDVISRCRPSNLERALLMVPLSCVYDILSAVSLCVQKHYKVEFSVRIAIFLMRIHQNYIINSVDMLPVVEKIAAELPKGVTELRDMIGFNLAALELFQLHIEEAQNIKLFDDIPSITKKTKKKNKLRKTIVMT